MRRQKSNANDVVVYLVLITKSGSTEIPQLTTARRPKQTANYVLCIPYHKSRQMMEEALTRARQKQEL